MPSSKRKPRPCALCCGPADGGHRMCFKCALALDVHYQMVLLNQVGGDQAAALARDPDRLDRLARYEDRADHGLPLFG